MQSLSIFISVTPCPAAELVGDLRCFQQHLNILKLNAYNETLGIPRLWRTRYLYRLPASRPAPPATNGPAPSRPSHSPLAVVHHGADCKGHLSLTRIPCGGFSVRTVTRRAARVANLRTEPENLRTTEHRCSGCRRNGRPKNHEHVPDIQAARRS